MSKKTIAVDIDDVLAASAQAWVDFSNDKWGTNLTVEDYDEDWAKMWQIDHESMKKRALVIYKSGTVKKVKRYKDAMPVLKWLAKRYKLVITTSRVRHTQVDTIEWLDEHYPSIFEEVHFAGFYDDLKEDAPKHTKADLLREIGADYLIDDHPKHCFAAAEVGIKSILFNEYVWSRNLGKLPKGVTRAYNWQEVLEYFKNEQHK
jgi:uncharacterized HAD superfamily protein